jgi:hypothetical protein
MISKNKEMLNKKQQMYLCLPPVSAKIPLWIKYRGGFAG